MKVEHYKFTYYGCAIENIEFLVDVDEDLDDALPILIPSNQLSQEEVLLIEQEKLEDMMSFEFQLRIITDYQEETRYFLNKVKKSFDIDPFEIFLYSDDIFTDGKSILNDELALTLNDEDLNAFIQGELSIEMFLEEEAFNKEYEEYRLDQEYMEYLICEREGICRF